MSRKIKVRKNIVHSPILVKVERNEYMASKFASFPVLTSLPHSAVEITAVTGKVTLYYGEHVNGDKDATIKMYAQVETMDAYYYDTAEYVEIVANANNDSSLPVSLGLELYAEKGPRKPKTFKAYDGDHAGEIYFEYPVIANAAAYSIEVAEVSEGNTPVFNHENSCSITSFLITGKKPNTRYLLRVAGIFSDGEGVWSEPIPIRTRDWQ